MAFNEISRIRNPIARSALSAWVSFTAAVMIAGVIIGFKIEKNDKQFATAGYVSLAAAVVGGIYGLLRHDASDLSSSQNSEVDSAWTDWRDFVVFRKVQESNEITSFYLVPKDKGPLPSFKPGQFLTIKLDIPGQQRPIIRTYSLSDFTSSQDHYRLSIKRERAPKDLEVPAGVASNFMHDHVVEGTVIQAKPPNGKFVLDAMQDKPAILISNGVGITPMISMAKAVSLLNPKRHVWFLHGARNGDFHAFRNEIAAIAQTFQNLHVYYRYSRPIPEDEGHYHSTGYVDTEMLKTIIAPEIEKAYGRLHQAEYFLCGSPRFMDSLRDGLKEWGVSDNQVFFESFSKPKASLQSKSIESQSASASSTINNIETGEHGIAARVTFAKSNKTAIWTPDKGTLLEFAEAQGLEPDYSCRSGLCLTCMCQIREGEVYYDEQPTGTPEKDSALICLAKPKSEHVVLEL